MKRSGWCVVCLAAVAGLPVPGRAALSDEIQVYAGTDYVPALLRFFKRRGPVFDSLSRNAYGIYLLHYTFAIWLQYALLKAPLTGLEKGGIVFATTLVLSWATTALLRSFPTVARVI